VDGNYRLTILASQVSGNGQPLDGDANGTAGGDFTMDLFRLFGDVNGDKAVDGFHLTAFRSEFGVCRVTPATCRSWTSTATGRSTGPT
jgi:hypothetical protein